MSYTSKYTGPEIDSLLDKVGSISFNETVLFEGKYLIENDTMSEKNILNNNIKNYDYIALVTAQEVPSGEYAGWLVRQNTIFVDVSTALTENIGSTVAIWCSNFGAGTGTTGYTVTGNFGDGTQIGIQWITKQSGVSDRKHYVLKVVGLKLSPAASSAVSSNPIGSIIPVIGMEAPKDYIICDGKELKVVDYPELADYFEKQFGSKNHFGGDGTTTFAIPDLRNEFLRGYHGDAELQLSGEIGEHQDATKHINTYGNAYGKGLAFGNASEDLTQAQNTDTTETFTYGYAQITGTKYTDVNPDAYYTARPTNVAVLFCIKYTESGSANGGSSYREKELLSAPVEYTLKNSATILNQELTINEDVTNYDELVFSCAVARSTDGGYTGTGQIRTLVSLISYNTSNDYTKITDGSNIHLNVTCNGGGPVFMATCSTYFKNKNTLAISYTASSNTNYNKFVIRSIKGIKY